MFLEKSSTIFKKYRLWERSNTLDVVVTFFGQEDKYDNQTHLYRKFHQFPNEEICTKVEKGTCLKRLCQSKGPVEGIEKACKLRPVALVDTKNKTDDFFTRPQYHSTVKVMYNHVIGIKRNKAT